MCRNDYRRNHNWLWRQGWTTAQQYNFRKMNSYNVNVRILQIAHAEVDNKHHLLD